MYRLFAALLCLALAACAGTTTTPYRYYTLTPVSTAAPPRATPLAVEVVSVRLPQYLERPQIVTRSAPNRLELAEFHQWGGDLRKDMTRLLAKNLTLQLGVAAVSIAPYRAAAAPDVRVELEVMAFERGPDGRVHLSAQWQLLDGDGGQSLGGRLSDLFSERPSSDYDATVAAMSTLYGRLSAEIAAAITAAVSHGH